MKKWHNWQMTLILSKGPSFMSKHCSILQALFGSLVLQTLLGGDSGKKSHDGIPQKGITDPTIKKERVKMVMQKTLVGLHKFVKMPLQKMSYKNVLPIVMWLFTMATLSVVST